jgi:hypothetical protein
MRTVFTFVLLLFIVHNVLVAQSIITSRTIDFSSRANGSIGPFDEGRQIILVDSNTYLSQVGVCKYSYVISSQAYFNPTLLISDSSLNLIDTISFPDTASTLKVCYDARYKRIWMVSIDLSTYSLRFRKITLNGEVLVHFFWPSTSNTLLLSGNIQKLYPDDNGGFYMLSSRPTTLNGQNVEPWMVSRFDSTGTVLWQQEYIYNYAYGRPQYLEKLPNGKLFVSGYAGRQIYSIEIDPATGNATNRKVIYNYPAANRGWSRGHAIRCANGGYFIEAFCPRSVFERDSSYALVAVDSSFHTTWQNYSKYTAISPIAIKDTTVWLMKNDSNITMSYSHYDFNGSRLHKIILFRAQNFDANHINDVAHFSNGNAAFIGSTGLSPYTGGALYFCKISRIGVPYNPTYPAWPPIPTSDTTTAVASINNEPALQLYPNPGHATMHVSHTGELFLYNLQGQLVLHRSTQAGDVVSTSSLPSGAYLAHFQTKTGWLTSRWIKE